MVRLRCHGAQPLTATQRSATSVGHDVDLVALAERGQGRQDEARPVTLLVTTRQCSTKEVKVSTKSVCGAAHVLAGGLDSEDVFAHPLLHDLSWSHPSRTEVTYRPRSSPWCTTSPATVGGVPPASRCCRVRWKARCQVTGQAGHQYNKPLRKAAELLRRVTRVLATDTTVWSDDVWIVDSTPVECGRSRETVKRSDLAGWAEYGYCADHDGHARDRAHAIPSCRRDGMAWQAAQIGACTTEQDPGGVGSCAAPYGRRGPGGSSRPDARLGVRQRTPKARITVWVTVFPAVSWAVARRETKRARFCGATG